MPPPISGQAEGGGPTLTLKAEHAIRVASLDPHVARILGTAWDDFTGPETLDGNAYAYRVVGRWLGTERRITVRTSDLATMHKEGITAEILAGPLKFSDDKLVAKLGSGDRLRLSFDESPESLKVVGNISDKVLWLAFDASGERLASGYLTQGLAALFGTGRRLLCLA